MFNQKTTISCGPYELDFGKKTLIMGILNVTPDSFSDGGRFNEIDAAVEQAKKLVADGADIIDIGGESTRPGAEMVTEVEELERVIPVIQAIAKEVAVPISIDTYKAEVAKQAILAGAHIINDVWGGKADSRMSQVAAELDVPFIIMHNRSDVNYKNFIRDSFYDIYESLHMAKKAGVKDHNIIVDPGIGFAKDLKQNIEMMRSLDQLVGLGYPVLLGTSRKSMIGAVLDLPANDRLEGTGATVCYGIQKGCQIIRVHDVKEMARMAKMMDALVGKGEHDG
ncbi:MULTISPECIES: dihydropteroate synthase [Bacillus]|uniref:dihydropteroate synthase n=1 Tax=Bacillus TaxID=1386 RepID=UPI0002F443C9|nr:MULTISPECIES: dihydropteroate synthase [Bacillus]